VKILYLDKKHNLHLSDVYVIVIYIISGIKAILQDSSVKIADL
jgi:hypothetical protein